MMGVCGGGSSELIKCGVTQIVRNSPLQDFGIKGNSPLSFLLGGIHLRWTIDRWHHCINLQSIDTAFNGTIPPKEACMRLTQISESSPSSLMKAPGTCSEFLCDIRVLLRLGASAASWRSLSTQSSRAPEDLESPLYSCLAITVPSCHPALIITGS